jgi:plasmid stabilization system protein ParE
LAGDRPVRLGEPASDELTEAVRWYERRRQGLGAEFFDAVAATISLIEQSPEIGAKHSVDGHTRRILVAKFPYQLVYRIRPQEIVIAAVAHLKRRPGYWKNRPTSIID